MNICNLLSIYSIFFLVLSTSALSTTYDVVNLVPHTPGGARFERDLGTRSTILMLRYITSNIHKILRQPNESDQKNVPKVTLYVKDIPPPTMGVMGIDHVNISQSAIAGFPQGRALWYVQSLLYHEMTHIWQWFGTKENHFAPPGLIEGIAEYVMIHSLYYDRTRMSKRGSGTKWDQGYDKTALFLMYCDELKVGFTAELNKKMRYGYSDHFFVELLGKSVDELWRDYKNKYPQ